VGGQRGAVRAGLEPECRIPVSGECPPGIGGGCANSTVDGRTGVTLIQQDFAVTTTGLGTLSSSGGNLLAYLNAQYGNGAGAGQYVVFRFNPDSSTLGTTAVGYNFSSVDNGTNPIPSITYTAIPEPGGGALLLLGGVLMTRSRSRK
jgi:hypothetical protein